MDFPPLFNDGDDTNPFLFDNEFMQKISDRKSNKRSSDDNSDSESFRPDIVSFFPEMVLGKQIKEKTQTNSISKKTTAYLSAVMDGIAKYVLEKAGIEKSEYSMPESKCIRVSDVEKVLTSVGITNPEANVLSRQFLHGSSICLDSINDSLVEQTSSKIQSYVKDYVTTSQLTVSPSPLLQDYMLHMPAMDDGVIIITYCERISTCLEFQRKTEGMVLIPRSLRLLIAVSMAHGKTRQPGLLLLRDYVNSFHDSVHFTVDILLDACDNSPYYSEYNKYRRNMARRDKKQTVVIPSQIFNLETEQLVFYKVVRDLLHGRWVVVIPRYCHPEGWEFEQMIKVSEGIVDGYQICKISLEFNTKSLNTKDCIVYSDSNSVIKKYDSLKSFQYFSPWSEEICGDKNKTVLFNLGLLCLCPIEVIPVLYHHIYYQSSIVLFSSLPEDHPSIKDIVDIIRGNMV